MLLGVALAEDLGLIQYVNSDTDETVEAALASLGEVIKTAGDSQVRALRLTFAAHGEFSFYPTYRAADHHALSSGGETGSLKEDIPIHKLNRIFLI